MIFLKNFSAQSVLYHGDQVYVKRKNQNPTFDITMGGYHGAEACELVGLYMLSKMTEFIPKSNVGLYRDDGLMVIRKQSGRETEKMKQKLHRFAKGIGLGLEIEGPMQSTDFLDITLDLKRQTYAPYRKENNEIKYINIDSNHPKSITRQIPNMIGQRITKRSINEEEFNKAANEYNTALEKSGYTEKIKYEPETPSKTKPNRKRKVIWFNPPFCNTVQTRISRKFINLIKTCFTSDNPLKKIFNKNTIKLSFSCMPNIGNIINKHNKKILKNTKDKKTLTKPCNCTKFDCPIKNKKVSCRTESVIYEATVQTKNDKHTYIGLTGGEFKKRYYQHRHDFKDETKKIKPNYQNTWKLKKNNTEYNISWNIIKQVSQLKNGNKMCRLCLTEASMIMVNKKDQLNKRTEILNKCRHQNKFLLKNWKERDKKITMQRKQ